MQDKVLKTISEDVLLKLFDYNGQYMIFKDYLIKEVLPYIDLNKDTIKLKSGIEVSLKEFIEQSILYTCQNRYHGNFIKFAQDNIVDKIDKQDMAKEEKKVLDVCDDDKTYVFYEELTGPKYLVVISSDNVLLACKDGENDIVMEDKKDKKDFLTRIKKLDLDLFVDMYNGYDVFREFVKSFSIDKMFYNSLMVGVENRTSFDDNFDKELTEISQLINSVESGNLYGETEIDEEVTNFDVSTIPLFDTNICLEIVRKKCRAFYSEFVNDIDSVMEQNSVLEKSEYIIDEYLDKTINHSFYNYVSNVAEAVNNNSEVFLNESFVSDELENIISNLKDGLKKIFVNPTSNYDTVTAEVYIKIIIDAIKNELVKYEELVNCKIKDKLNEIGIHFSKSDTMKKVS